METILQLVVALSAASDKAKLVLYSQDWQCGNNAWAIDAANIESSWWQFVALPEWRFALSGEVFPANLQLFTWGCCGFQVCNPCAELSRDVLTWCDWSTEKGFSSVGFYYFLVFEPCIISRKSSLILDFSSRNFHFSWDGWSLFLGCLYVADVLWF